MDELSGASEDMLVQKLVKLCPDSTVEDWGEKGPARRVGTGSSAGAGAGAGATSPVAGGTAGGSLLSTLQADPNFLAELVGLGIPEATARRALLATGNRSLEAATEMAFTLATEGEEAAQRLAAEKASSAALETCDAASGTCSLPPTDTGSQLATLEEIQRKLAAAREQKRLEQEKRQQESERARITSGKKAQEDQEQFAHEQSLRDIDESRREAIAEAQWRKDVMEKIRLQQLERETGIRGDALEAPPEQTALPRYTPPAEGPCQLQIRLPDGSRLTHTFSAADSVQTVANWIEQNHPRFALFFLQTPPPVTQFIGEKVYTTLSQAGLAPRGVLILKTT